jgi:hypothetical protein
VTADKIADDSVDLARIKNAPFTANNAEATVKVLRVDSNSANLTLDTLAAADISDFNSSVTAQPVSAFTQAQRNVSMGAAGGTQYKIVNVADPTSDQDAATKVYVDNALGSGNKETLISDTTLASDSATFTIEGWFDDSKYINYRFVFLNLRHSRTDTTFGDIIYIGARLKNSSGVYPSSTSDYMQGAWSWIAQVDGGASTTNSVAAAELTIYNNVSSNTFRKQGWSHYSYSDAGQNEAFVGDIGFGYRTSTSTIEGLELRPVKSSTVDTSTSGVMYAGCRVLVYGYEGLS